MTSAIYSALSSNERLLAIAAGTALVEQVVRKKSAAILNRVDEKNRTGLFLTRCLFRFVDLPQIATAAIFTFRFYRWLGTSRGHCYFSAASVVAFPLACKARIWWNQDALDWDSKFRFATKIINVVAGGYYLSVRQNSIITTLARVYLVRSLYKSAEYLFYLRTDKYPLDFESWTLCRSSENKEPWI